jgi:hypothetical protein
MSSLQDHIETIERYRQGCEPGSGTRAILAMDLHGAIAHADGTTQLILADIVRYIVNNLDPALWGNYGKVDGWLKKRRADMKGVER